LHKAGIPIVPGRALGGVAGEIDRRWRRRCRRRRRVLAHGGGGVVEVIDLIHPRLDPFHRRQRARHVAGDGHAEPVRFVGNRADHVGREEGVELDLLEPGVVIAPHHGAALIGRFGDDMAESFFGAGIDQARQQETRTNRVLVLDGVALRDQVVELATAVARRRDPGGQQRRPELDARKMRMHLPQPGQHGLPRRIDRRHPARR
jgi:hypothetical protein